VVLVPAGVLRAHFIRFRALVLMSAVILLRVLLMISMIHDAREAVEIGMARGGSPRSEHNAEVAVPHSDTTAKTTPFTSTIRSFPWLFKRSPGAMPGPQKGIPISVTRTRGAALWKAWPQREQQTV